MLFQKNEIHTETNQFHNISSGLICKSAWKRFADLDLDRATVVLFIVDKNAVNSFITFDEKMYQL